MHLCQIPTRADALKELRSATTLLKQAEQRKPSFLSRCMLQRFMLLLHAHEGDYTLSCDTSMTYEPPPMDLCVAFMDLMAAAVKAAPDAVLAPSLRVVDTILATSLQYMVVSEDSGSVIGSHLLKFLYAAALAVKRTPALRVAMITSLQRNCHAVSFLKDMFMIMPAISLGHAELLAMVGGMVRRSHSSSPSTFAQYRYREIGHLRMSILNILSGGPLDQIPFGLSS
jgi:hypothetical protein